MTFRQALNPADRLMLVGHDVMRSVGHGGFQCQTHAWLEGRIDASGLRAALGHLARLHPVVTSRLSAEDKGDSAAWQCHSENPPELHEHTLEGAGRESVWQTGAALCERPLDHANDPPIAFHLLHLSDGRDVFIIRYGHALMDGKSPEFALHRISECFEKGEATPPAPEERDGDEMRAYLASFATTQRAWAALRIVRSHIRWPVKSVTLVPPENRDVVAAPLALMSRTLDPDQTSRVNRRVRELCGFSNLTPAVLASTFRAVSRLSRHPKSSRDMFQTDIPLNLRKPGTRHPIFRNLMSFIQLGARHDQLADRNELTRFLNADMRNQLRRKMDLGNLQMMKIMSGRARALGTHIRKRMKDHPLTLPFGFLGQVSPGLERLCNQKVQAIHTFNTAISPPGVTLQANQCFGCLNLMLSYISSVIPDAMAGQFLDEVASDLLA
jgi:hypothetical protein